FAGDTVPVFDGLTGEVRAAKIFVAVMGASNYTFVQARFSEALPDWIGAHVDALTFLGGVPKALVCDNLKAGVTTRRAATSRGSTGPTRISRPITAPPSCRRGRASPPNSSWSNGKCTGALSSISFRLG
ncbi:hypothetical protein ABID58_007454, partial [Bradyrhizobium sp. S3.2.6]